MRRQWPLQFPHPPDRRPCARDEICGLSGAPWLLRGRPAAREATPVARVSPKRRLILATPAPYFWGGGTETSLPCDHWPLTRARAPCSCPLSLSVTDESKLNVTVLEAVAIEDLDPEAVKLGLAQYSAAYAAATEDLAKSEAEIGVEVYQAMSYAIAEP